MKQQVAIAIVLVMTEVSLAGLTFLDASSTYDPDAGILRVQTRLINGPDHLADTNLHFVYAWWSIREILSADLATLEIGPTICKVEYPDFFSPVPVTSHISPAGGLWASLPETLSYDLSFEVTRQQLGSDAEMFWIAHTAWDPGDGAVVERGTWTLPTPAGLPLLLFGLALVRLWKIKEF